MGQNLRYFVYSFFVVLLLNACGVSADSPRTDELPTPHFTSGEPYGHVRTKLIEAGWEPVVSEESDTCMKGDVRCTNRPEMEACSGSGVAPCKFVWRKKNYTLRVSTVGIDATDDGDAAFDSLEISEVNSSQN